MAKRYVKALVLDGAFSSNEFTNGQIVTLDLNDFEYTDTDQPVVNVVGGGKRYVSRFAIDPILSTRGN